MTCEHGDGPKFNHLEVNHTEALSFCPPQLVKQIIDAEIAKLNDELYRRALSEKRTTADEQHP